MQRMHRTVREIRDRVVVPRRSRSAPQARPPRDVQQWVDNISTSWLSSPGYGSEYQSTIPTRRLSSTASRYFSLAGSRMGRLHGNVKDLPAQVNSKIPKSARRLLSRLASRLPSYLVPIGRRHITCLVAARMRPGFGSQRLHTSSVTVVWPHSRRQQKLQCRLHILLLYQTTLPHLNLPPPLELLSLAWAYHLYSSLFHQHLISYCPFFGMLPGLSGPVARAHLFMPGSPIISVTCLPPCTLLCFTWLLIGGKSVGQLRKGTKKKKKTG